MRPMFQGSIVALVTPFRGGKVDEAKLRELVEMHVASGTDGIVPCGTTGESPDPQPRRAQARGGDRHRGGARAAAASSRAPAPTPPPRRSTSPRTPRRPAPPARSWSTRTTTSRPRRGSTATSAPSPRRWTSRSSSTTSRAAPRSTSRRTRWRASSSDCPNIVGVKEASGSLDQMTQVILACGPDFTRALRRRQHHPAPHVGRRPRRHLGHRQHRAAGDRRDDACRARRATGSSPASCTSSSSRCRARCSSRPTPSRSRKRWRMMGMLRAGVPPADVPDGRGQPASGSGRVLRPARPRQGLSPPLAWRMSSSPAPPAGWAVVSSRCSRRTRSCASWPPSRRPGHPALGKDAGEVAGVGRLGVPITADPEGVLGRDRILIEFSVPEASLAHLRMVARGRAAAR